MILLLIQLACLQPYPEANGRFVEDPNHDFDGDGKTENEGDCNDDDATVFKGASELCDNQDNDCDGLIDDNPIDARQSYLDADNDGVVQVDFTVSECQAPLGYIPLVKDEKELSFYVLLVQFC